MTTSTDNDIMSFSLPSEADGPQDPVIMLRGFVLTAAEEQKKWAQEALLAVESKSAVMQSAIASRKGLSAVIRAAALMLDELRTNLLEPQNYYELYMKVFTEMESFVQYLEDTYRSGEHTLEAIYEHVQYCGYIVPRLYLLIAAGAVYIKVGQQPALDIMRDLVEMCKGVQHPTRGLFLRHFLLTLMKEKLPGDVGRPVGQDGGGGTVTDTANLLVQNFKEMNWLWIRMEAGSYVNRNGGSTNSITTGAGGAAAPSSPTARSTASSSSFARQTQPQAQQQQQQQSNSSVPASPRSPLNNQQRSLRMAQRTQQERKAMCVLVGMNLVRISQLDGITRDVYVNTLLPQLLSIIVRYCEPLAQQYLFEVLIQVFPDEFHLFTLDKLFDAMSRTVHGVDVPTLLRTLMERLCRYAMDVQDGVTDVSGPEEESQLRDLFPILLDRLACLPVSFRSQVIGVSVIKRTSAVPQPTPMLLGAYINTLRCLVTVALTLYGTSQKRRVAAVASIVDVVAAKVSAARAAAADAVGGDASDASPTAAAAAAGAGGGEDHTNTQKKPPAAKAKASGSSNNSSSSPAAAAGASASATAGSVGISPAAALAASQFLVHIITECCATVDEVLAMESVETLTSCLPFLERRDVAMAVCDVALRGSTAAPLLPSLPKSSSNGSGGASHMVKTLAVVTAPPPRARPLTAIEDVARLFELLDPLLVDQPDTPTDPQLIYKYNPEMEFVDEQHAVCRVLHLLAHDDPAVYLKMLTGVRKLLLMGGARRIPITCPTLIALHRRAAVRMHVQYVNSNAAAEAAAAGGEGGEAGEAAAAAAYAKNIRKCLGHLYSGDGKSVLEVYAEERPLLALTEYVSCALTADVCEQTDTSYAMFAEALTLYDGHVSDSADQVNTLVTFVNALSQIRTMSEENYEVLAAKVCQYASKLLKKHDQSRLIAVCATLFAKKHLSQESQQRVEECLRRALKLAGQVLALPQLQLYVQLLNVFLHFYTAKMGYVVSVELINELVEKINEASEAQRLAVSGKGDDEATTAAAAGGDGKAKSVSDEAAAEVFASIRLVYRNITKYIRSRQSAEESWNAIEV